MGLMPEKTKPSVHLKPELQLGDQELHGLSIDFHGHLPHSRAEVVVGYCERFYPLFLVLKIFFFIFLHFVSYIVIW